MEPLTAAAGLPPLSGLWPKVALLKASLDIGAWWLAAAIVISAFIVTLALARVFLLAFWRPRPEPAPELAIARDWRIAWPLGCLTALSILFGLFPETVLDLSQRAATGLAEPSAYIRSVFPGGAAP
jgi:multicomponent Na+:H+ antiporter subunit D